MSALEVFAYAGQQVRTVVVDGEPWFVAADVCGVLEIANPRTSLALLDEDERGVHTVDTLGGPQQVTVINEAGLYSLILRSRKPEAKAFKRWVTHDVLPAIRRTGRYGSDVAMLAALPSSELLTLAAEAARQKEEATARAVAAESQVKELEPAARAWQDIASGDGSWAAREAAQMLCNVGVTIGQNRLLLKLDELGWTFWQGGERKIKQTAREGGLLEPRAYPPRYKPSGERRQVAPQVRITGKGLDRLVRELGGQPALAVVT